MEMWRERYDRKLYKGEKYVIGSLECMMKGSTINMEMMKTLHDSTIVPALTEASETVT